MSVAAFLRNGLRLLIPLALASTVFLYLYPFFGRCAFPLPSRDVDAAFEATKTLHWPLDRGLDDLSRQLQRIAVGHSEGEGDQPASPPSPPTKLAPFRLLVLADPQLEGDTSIPTNLLGTFPHVKSIVRHLTWQTQHWCFRERLRQVAHDLVDICFEDIPYLLMSLHKRFDLVGNDFFLAHIYRTLHWWTRPTHVTVLGDLLGSQWIGDDEFERRSSRYWDRAFRGGERVPDDAASWPENAYDLAGVLGDEYDPHNVWARRMINVAGNHDIGYAGDLTPELLERYERVFGKANYELRFGVPANASLRDADYMRVEPEIRIVVLNDMNLDAPAKDTSLQDATYHFLNTVIATSALVEQEGIFTLVLTHIPLHKPQGLCVDAPFFDFHGADDGSGVREQNMLSPDASRGFLQGIYGMSADPLAAAGGRGRKGLILNGHDHEGCDTYHFVNQTNGTSAAERSWEAARWADAQARGLPALTTAGLPGRREITVRSMMGGFGGNAGLLSLWFDEERWEWEYEFVTCPLGTQHMWWLTHFLDAGVLLMIVLYGVVSFLTAVGVDVDGRICRCFGSSKGTQQRGRRKSVVEVRNGRRGVPS